MLKVLDLTAGRRAMWFDKQWRGAVFVDVRLEVVPDVVASSAALPIGVEAGFDLVVFDPPHRHFQPTSFFAAKYGTFTRAEIHDLIRDGACEAHRVCRPGALMVFKWNNCSRPLNEQLDLMARWWYPLFGTKEASRGGGDTDTSWTLLVRRDLPGG